MRRFGRHGLLVGLMLLGPALVSALRADEKRLGTKPPEWEVRDWINSRPLTLKELTGKVVLVRWWTAPGCPYCAATAPALNEFHEQYQSRGLAIIGFYHHKASTPLDVGDVKRSAAKFGFKFPVAVDPEWRTLKRWWLDDGGRRWTSVSFLIDRQGVIRHIHPGGSYVRGDKAYAALQAKIEELLNEK
jgi:thiol-disulfide isomerase/thioredoxin